MSRTTHAPLGPQVVHQFFFQQAPRLNEQAPVNRATCRVDCRLHRELTPTRTREYRSDPWARKTHGSRMSARLQILRYFHLPTRGMCGQTSPVSRASSCPISAVRGYTDRNATKLLQVATKALPSPHVVRDVVSMSTMTSISRFWVVLDT